jgi:hypothetical protein
MYSAFTADGAEQTQRALKDLSLRKTVPPCAKVQMMSGAKIDMQVDQMAHNKHDRGNEIHT